MAQAKSPQKGQLIPRNKYLLLLALVTLVVGVLQWSDLIELPFGAWFSSLSGSSGSATSLVGLMNQYGYASLFALMALESASLPIPSEVVLPFAGYLVSIGVMNFWVAVAVSTAASMTGALADYFLAAWLGRPFVVRLLKAFKLHTVGLESAERWFARSAQWTVFVARFVPGLRTIISLPAGLFRMRLSLFSLMTFAGCLAWSVILIYAGYLAGSGGYIFTSSPVVVGYLSALVALVSAGYVLYFLYPKLVRRSATTGQASGS